MSGLELPLPMRTFPLRAIAPKVAMMDAGVGWLFAELEAAARAARGKRC